jgi:hypothetical protein
MLLVCQSIRPASLRGGENQAIFAARDQKRPAVSAATHANTRDLAKWHVDHAAHSQWVLFWLPASHQGERVSLADKCMLVRPAPCDCATSAAAAVYAPAQ